MLGGEEQKQIDGIEMKKSERAEKKVRTTEYMDLVTLSDQIMLTDLSQYVAVKMRDTQPYHALMVGEILSKR